MRANELIADIRIKISRGQGWFYDIRNAVLITAGLKVMLNLSTLTAGILAVLLMVGFFIIGWIDLKYWRVMQSEQQLNTERYNPHLKKIAEIYKWVKEQKKRKV